MRVKRILFTLSLVFLTNLATYLVCVGIYEQGYRELETKNDIALKALRAYERRLHLDQEYIALTKDLGKAFREDDSVTLNKFEQDVGILMPKFDESNKELEQIKSDIERINESTGGLERLGSED